MIQKHTLKFDNVTISHLIEKWKINWAVLDHADTNGDKIMNVSIYKTVIVAL